MLPAKVAVNANKQRCHENRTRPTRPLKCVRNTSHKLSPDAPPSPEGFKNGGSTHQKLLHCQHLVCACGLEIGGGVCDGSLPLLRDPDPQFYTISLQRASGVRELPTVQYALLPSRGDNKWCFMSMVALRRALRDLVWLGGTPGTRSDRS